MWAAFSGEGRATDTIWLCNSGYFASTGEYLHYYFVTELLIYVLIGQRYIKMVVGQGWYIYFPSCRPGVPEGMEGNKVLSEV